MSPRAESATRTTQKALKKAVVFLRFRLLSALFIGLYILRRLSFVLSSLQTVGKLVKELQANEFLRSCWPAESDQLGSDEKGVLLRITPGGQGAGW